MRAERHDDLVPPLAIVAGAVVSVVVTFLAFYGGGDEAAPAHGENPAISVEWEAPVLDVVAPAPTPVRARGGA